MKSSRIVRLIEILPKKKKEKFLLFAQSPYFNQHKKTIDLLKLILSQIDKKNNKGLEKEVVFKKLFPTSAFEEQQLHNLMSSLKKLYNKFMAVQYMEEQEYQEQLFLLEAANKQNLGDFLKNRGKQLDKILEKTPSQDTGYLYAKYRMNKLIGFYIAEYEDRTDSKLLQEMLDNFNYFYVAEMLENCCHLRANMIAFNSQFNFRFLNDLLAYLDENWDDYKEIPSIELYHTILMSLMDGETTIHYNKLKDILENKTDKLSAKEGHDLYRFSYNYCIQRINAGISEYIYELFELYKTGLDTGLILQNGILSEWDYKNIATLGCNLKEFEWTKNFIESYNIKLHPSRQENAYKFNMANLFYNSKNYDKTLELLINVEFPDVKYNLNTNFLILRTLYAMNNTEFCLHRIEAFRIYVMRSRKMTTDQKRGYTNLLRFAKKLVLLRPQANTYSEKSFSEKLKALKQKLVNAKNVINKFWLLEELEKLESGIVV